MQGFVIPELPKKRWFNTGETVIETRRSELDVWIKALVRNRELREDATVDYFLKQQDGLNEYLGNVNMYSWAYASLRNLGRNYMSYEMISAVTQANLETSFEPDQFALTYPNNMTKDTFLADLADKIAVLTQLRDQFSQQAKLVERQAQEMYNLGVHLQKITSINSGDSHHVRGFGHFDNNDNEEFDLIVEDTGQPSTNSSV